MIRENLRNQIFLSYIDEEIILSDSLKKIVLYKKDIAIDQKIIENYKKNKLIFPPYTIFKNIFCIPYFNGIQTFGNVFEIRQFFPKKTLPFKRQLDFERYLENYILSQTEKNIYLLFSGGADSLFIFYNLLKKTKNLKRNIIVKMKGMEKDYFYAKKISDYYNINSISLENFSSEINHYVNFFLEESYEPLQDPIAPIYLNIIEKNSNYGDELFFDGQGADSLLMGLPHNLLVKLYTPYLNKIFFLFNLLFFINVMPNSRFKRLYYRVGKIFKALSKDNWIDCFLSTLEIEKNNSSYNDLSKKLKNFYNHFNCKQKSISFFFMTAVLDAREMQKYRFINKKYKIILPFLDHKLIEKVFSTPTQFFFSFIFKKKPIYTFVNKFKFKINIFKTSPFFVNYKITKKQYDIYNYSLNKLNKLIKQ